MNVDERDDSDDVQHIPVGRFKTVFEHSKHGAGDHGNEKFRHTDMTRADNDG